MRESHTIGEKKQLGGCRHTTHHPSILTELMPLESPMASYIIFIHQGSNGGLCVEDVGHVGLDILDLVLVDRVCAVGVVPFRLAH